jgi:hypothetical protein
MQVLNPLNANKILQISLQTWKLGYKNEETLVFLFTHVRTFHKRFASDFPIKYETGPS